MYSAHWFSLSLLLKQGWTSRSWAIQNPCLPVWATFLYLSIAEPPHIYDTLVVKNYICIYFIVNCRKVCIEKAWILSFQNFFKKTASFNGIVGIWTIFCCSYLMLFSPFPEKRKFFLKNHFVILRFKLNLKWHITSQNYEFRNSIGHFDTCRNQNKYTYSKEVYDILLFVIGMVKVT